MARPVEHGNEVFERILVGFDGSVHSRRAVQVASELAGRFQSALTIAIVRPTAPREEVARLEALVPISADGRTLVTILEEMRAQALTLGARAADPVTLHGEVLNSLLDYLSRNPHDLVVVGSRGLTPGRRLLLGSVSSGSLTRPTARCSSSDSVVRPQSLPWAPHAVGWGKRTAAPGECLKL